MNAIWFALTLVLAAPAGDTTNDAIDEARMAEAIAIAQEVPIADTHIDVPYRLWDKMDDISNATEGGDFDYPRARAGGLDVVFMSIYTPWKLEGEGGSKALADSLIDLVEGFAVQAPDKFAVAHSLAETIAFVEQDKIALTLGMENGSPIESDLDNVRYFYDRGVRYITLTHSRDNHICDSSYDESDPTWGGLSPFGRAVVAEMNRLGIMIDVSHVSDDSFYQVMELSKAPAIASHSSCRHFTPGWERNMDDDMIRLLAEKGGVIQINFGSVFINEDVRRRFYNGVDAAKAWARDNDIDSEDPRVREWRDAYFVEHPYGFADVTDVADHIDHVVEIAGVDHVGLGSDYDGVGDSLPTGLKDVSQYPNLIYELLGRGYSREDIEKVCGGNLFRVWAAVEFVAGESNNR